ncbi:MAG TPA: hydroxysqualene dehydroxylase HpnE [Mycobacteriales bacterium]|nr:hydroxysqualene dehydroxylase HpnE [Mycobacteriales bacterium]
MTRPAPAGSGRTRVGVVGGGLAGITAALDLAAAGREVVLLESRPWLGGLASSFRRGGLTVDTGQHVFLRCCTAYRGFLDRLGVTGLTTLQPRLDIPVLTPGGRPARLRRDRLPAPLHLARALLGYGPLTRPERLSAARAVRALGRVDPADPAADTITFGAWLTAHGQGPRAVAALFDLIGVATLNLPAEEATLSLAAKVFRTGLLEDAAGADLGWSLVPLGRLHSEATAAALAAAGVTVRTSARVRGVERGREHGPERSGEEWRLVLDTESIPVDEVVLAVPPPAAEAFLPGGGSHAPAGWSQRLGASPIVNVHVRYDRQVTEHAFFATVGSPVQWAFDRTAGSGAQTGQYLAVSLSAAGRQVDERAADVQAEVLPALAAVLPAARAATVLDSWVTRERTATFRAVPGTAALRPPARTGMPGVVLAGAWTATGWPATMEGAVRSGHAAAQALLRARTPAGSGAGSGPAESSAPAGVPVERGIA